jgi:hypothetical protein
MKPIRGIPSPDARGRGTKPHVGRDAHDVRQAFVLFFEGFKTDRVQPFLKPARFEFFGPLVGAEHLGEPFAHAAPLIQLAHHGSPGGGPKVVERQFKGLDGPVRGPSQKSQAQEGVKRKKISRSMPLKQKCSPCALNKRGSGGEGERRRGYAYDGRPRERLILSSSSK